MQIKILLEDGSELEIEIELHEDIEDLKYLIDDEIEESGKSINYYQMVHEKIILNDKKQIIQFYNFSESKVVRIGKLEKFLKNNEFIVELIIQSVLESNSSFKETTLVHIIVDRNSSVSNIKSIIKYQMDQLKLNEIKVFDVKGNQLENEHIINNYGFNGYYRFLIVSSDNSKNFRNYSEKYDRFLVDHYLRNNDLTYLWYRNEFNEYRVDGLKYILNRANELISKNKNQANLEANLPTISTFMNCRFLFCDVMTNQICEICDDFYWREEIEPYDEIVVSVFRQYFRDAVRIEIIENVKRVYRSLDEKQIKIFSIVTAALDHCLKYLVYPTKDWRHLIRLYFGEFAFEFVSDSELDGLIKKWADDHSTIVIPYESTCGFPITTET